MQLLKHIRGGNIKSYSDLLINVSLSRNKMAFCTKFAVSECRNFLYVYFTNSISRFSAGIRLSRSADGGKKGRAYFSLLKKGKGLFFTFKKRAGRIFNFQKNGG